MNVDDVKKYLALAKELVQIGLVVSPEGKLKDKLKKVLDLLEKDVLVDAVVVVEKLVEEVKKLLS